MTARSDKAMAGELTIEERLSLAERIVRHEFSDRRLLRSALTHPSAVEARDPSLFYERLEFLGDSVVGLFIAEEAYRRYPDLAEGGLTRIKVSVVAGSVLSEVARNLGLTEALIVGASEAGTGSRGLSSALENTYEALTAALYLDGGIETARGWVLRTLGPLISADAAQTPENPKSVLQELLQSHGESPSYVIEQESGPPHNREFVAVVEVDGQVRGRGRGRTKKEAEAAAAHDALAAL
jgi:ribonuclease-3